MPTDQPRVMVTLDEDTFELLNRLKAITGLSVSAVINRMLGSKLEDLWEYEQWMSEARPVPKALRVNLLQSFGPDTLVQGIRRLDPTYKTQGQVFREGLIT